MRIAETFKDALHRIPMAEAVRFRWEHNLSHNADFGADSYLKLCITHLTTGDMIPIWTDSGIRCA